MQINYAGGTYALYPQTVAPGATTSFDFRQLRDRQTPDSSGRVLPVDFTIGQIRWSMVGGTATTLIGRSEIISKADKVSSSYSCNICCRYSYQSSRLTPDQVFEFLGGTTQLAPMQKDRDCYGNYFAEYEVSNANWDSSDWNVVEIYNGAVTALDVGGVQITATWETQYYLDSGSDTCDEYPVIATPTGEMVVVPPTVSIQAIKGVGKNRTAKFRIEVSNNPNNAPITLILSRTSGTGQANFTSNNSTTRTINQTTDVEVKGITESSTKRNIKIEAKYNNASLGTMNFTVVLVTLSLRFGNNNQVSTDNLGRLTYENVLGTANLGGPFLSSGTGQSLWRHGIEVVGTVLPSDLDEIITIKREIVENRQFNDQTLEQLLKQCPDTSLISFRDDDPQSNNSQGKVYDLDAPGVNLISTATAGRILRRRTNFRQWAILFQASGSENVESVISDDITWFQRISIVKTRSGTSILNDVAGDNIISSGATNLTWNLTSTTGTLPTPNPCPQN